MTTRTKRIGFTVAVALAFAAAVPLAALPAAGAWLLLHGPRRIAVPPAPDGCEATHFQGAGVDLAGWRCNTSARRRGTLIYLHGLSDNRKGVRGLVGRFLARGLDVVAYDGRAHGESTGDDYDHSRLRIVPLPLGENFFTVKPVYGPGLCRVATTVHDS